MFTAPFFRFRILATVLALFMGGRLPAQDFIGASEPSAHAASPLTPIQEQRLFSLPPGFEIELVTSEEQSVGKPVTVAWDDAGRLWTMTALEYPLDGNEQPEIARELYQKGGRDRVLVIDDPSAAGPHTPRVFADHLAMPMGILPYQDGAIVGQGPEVLFFHDSDGDGRADSREVILSGFGVQDSHLMPHQFTRVAGGWFYLAQGAFNYSKVRTKDGREHQFDHTRLARFTVDGMKFEDLTSGPCNIWGLVIDQEGQGFIQEANDYGYPVMALQHHASYPGCTGLYKPYAPYFPSEVDFRMGGTGLSGLALSDQRGSFPGAYADIMFVANPITRKVQAIKVHRDGPWFRYEKLPDFLLSSDEWFRPVSIHFGPDGCLYVVDWYNKIISHNEVPRNHPERDKTRGRIWRIRHQSQPRRTPPNVAAASNAELLKFLQSDSTWEMRAAWHQIVDRPVRDLVPALIEIVDDREARAAHRVHALWCLEELRALPLETIREWLTEPNRNLRREAVRSLATMDFPQTQERELLSAHKSDSDPEVRAEVIRVAASDSQFDLLMSMVKPSLDQPIGKNPQNGAPMKLREAYDRDFERYLIRSKFEEKPEEVERLLFSGNSRFSPESELLALLSLKTQRSTERLIALLARIERAPNEEELLRLIENFGRPQARETLTVLLNREVARVPTLEAMLRLRNRLESGAMVPILEQPLRQLWDSGRREFAARLAGSFKVPSMAERLEDGLGIEDSGVQVACLRALRELDRGDMAKIARLADAPERALRDEALNSISESKDVKALLQFWDRFNPVQRRTAQRNLTRNADVAREFVAALAERQVNERDLNSETVEKLRAYFPSNTEVRELAARVSSRFSPVLRLDGQSGSYVQTGINLEGPFTVETWVMLDPGIDNRDGILGTPGSADFNFHDRRFRVYGGPQVGDRIIARRPMAPNAWTHLAVSRDAGGILRIYINGELDSTADSPLTNSFLNLDVGRANPSGATAGMLTEYRVWNRARSGAEIRAEFDRTFAGEALPSGLVYYAPGRGPWGRLHGTARIEEVADAPKLITGEEARAREQLFARFRDLASQPGDRAHGQALFSSTCMICHSVRGQGAQIGPVLDGASANGVETLLRAVLTPNAAMESGYRNFHIDLTDGETLDGFLVSQDEKSYLIRQPNLEDQRIPLEKVRRAEFTSTSLMPEGLLQSLNESDAKDLLAYLQTLK